MSSEIKANKISPATGTALTIGDSSDTITFAGTVIGVAGGFASGTKMLFAQTSAPTGWTKDTTHDNKALRVVSGTAGSGGSVSFTTAFASQAVSGSIGNTTATNNATTAGGSVGNTTLTTAQIPSHNHSFTSRKAYDPGSSGNWGVIATNNTGALNGPLGGVLAVSPTASKGSGGTHNHSFTGSSHNHTQNAHNHSFTGTSINMAVQYVDVVIATKD